MGDAEEVSKSVKKTQDELGKFVKKPPLTDKNLTRPPFRFLHDIIKNVIDTTGFMQDVFTAEELDASNVTSRDAKTAFMQKLIGAIKERTGEEVPIKVSKVLAGLEADKTNGLLQALAKSIEAHQKETGSATKKGSGGKKAPPKAGGKLGTGTANKPSNRKLSPGDKKEKVGSGGSDGVKQTVRDPSPGSKQTSRPGKALRQDSKAKPSRDGGNKARRGSQVEETIIPESVVNDETSNNLKTEGDEPKKVAASSLRKKESSSDLLEKIGATASAENVSKTEVDMEAGEGITTTSATVAGLNNDDSLNNLSNNNYNNSSTPHALDDDGIDHELYDNFAASAVKPNMQTLPPPKSPLLTDADAVNATMELPASPTNNKSLSLSPTPVNLGRMTSPSSPLIAGGRSGSGRPPTGTGSRSLSREASAEQKSPFGSASIGEVRPPTGQQRSRPDTGTAGGRMTSARPPSARRAPPRPKSSVVREDPEPYRPTTGKVAHVILDDNEDPEDDNYVVREVTVTTSKPPGLSDLDETPELNMGGIGGSGGMLGGSMMMMSGEGIDDILPPDQRGLLVNQILETQKELEDKKEGETPMIEKKLKELSLAEVEKLKSLIQLCARSANPLAKLLDYMAEDVDSMQREYNGYREESKRLSLELENGKSETEKYLQNLKHELSDIERKIKDKEDAILASQMKIIQQEERIEEIVAGFERVRSGKSAAAAQEHMPPADEILAHIQGQSGNSSAGMSGLGGYGGGPSIPSVFAYSGSSGGGGGRLGSSTPSSAASLIGGGVASSLQPQSSQQDAFKIPDTFMTSNAGGNSNSAGNNSSSPFSRGRMWSNINNNNANNNGGSFNFSQSLIDEDNPMMDEQNLSSFNRRSTGRSGVETGSFRRSSGLSQLDQEDGDHNGGTLISDVDNFNPWK